MNGEKEKKKLLIYGGCLSYNYLLQKRANMRSYLRWFCYRNVSLCSQRWQKMVKKLMKGTEKYARRSNKPCIRVYIQVIRTANEDLVWVNPFFQSFYWKLLGFM